MSAHLAEARRGLRGSVVEWLRSIAHASSAPKFMCMAQGPKRKSVASARAMDAEQDLAGFEDMLDQRLPVASSI